VDVELGVDVLDAEVPKSPRPVSILVDWNIFSMLMTQRAISLSTAFRKAVRESDGTVVFPPPESRRLEVDDDLFFTVELRERAE
jgi:hypothetical protein